MLLLRIGRLRTLGQSVSIICVFIAAIVLSVVSLGSTFRQTLAAVVAESDSYIVASVGELASVPSEEGADELLLTCFIDIVDHASGAGAGAARDLRVVVVASSAATETASALDAIFASWRSANYDVIVVDDGGLPGGTLHAAAAGRAVLRVVHASEVACLGLQDSGTSAGILWAIAVGASSVVDLAHPLPLVSAALTLPPNDVTLLPGPADGATARVREHFTSALIVEARRPSRVGHGSSNDAGRRRGEELCVDPVVPDLQLGLCHDRTAWRYGRHSTAAANEPPESGDDSPVRLLEDVAPLVLPPGGVLEWSSHSDGDVAPRTAYSYNRLAGRKAVWLLMGSARSGSRAAVALQLAAAAAGLRIAMLPPGRLCNLSSASAAGVDGVSAAPAVGAAATVAAIAAPDGIAATSAAKAALSGVRDAVQLTMSEVLQMQRWLTLAHSAYKLAANATPSGVQQEQPKARDVTSLPHAHHCYRDHPNVRDTVLVLNFNNFPRNGGNASLPNWGPEQLARLRTLYAPYFPLIIATADVSAVGEAGIPDSNVVPCWGDFERRFGWPGGIVGEDCAARAIAAYPGHLGYAFVQVGAAVDGGVARHQYSLLPETLTRIRACPDNARAQDDVFWMPWNTLAYDVHRVWNVWRHPEQRTDFALDCKRTPGSDYCSGCFFGACCACNTVSRAVGQVACVQ